MSSPPPQRALLDRIRAHESSGRLFPRGFLLAREQRYVPEAWDVLELSDGWRLCHDRRAHVVRIHDARGELVVIDDAFSLEHPGHDTRVIADELLAALARSRSAWLEQLDRLHGRFALLLRAPDATGYVAVADATGARSMFHPKRGGMLASHAALCAANLGVEERSWRRTGYGLPGRTTPFAQVVQFIPNHELDVDSGALRRFWPREPLPAHGVEEAVTQAHHSMSQALAGIVARYPKPVFSLTGGMDSRVSLALCVEAGLTDRIEFFTYVQPADGPLAAADREIATRLAQRFSLRHELIMLDAIELTDADIELMGLNAYYRHKVSAALAYAERYATPEHIHVRSNVAELGRVIFRNDPEAPAVRSGKQLARKYRRWPKVDYSRAELAQLDEDFEDFYQATDFAAGAQLLEAYDLMAWEHRITTWYSQVIAGTDIAFQTVSPFNSRPVLTALMGAPRADRLAAKAMYELIERACPACMGEPINPKPSRLSWTVHALRKRWRRARGLGPRLD